MLPSIRFIKLKAAAITIRGRILYSSDGSSQCFRTSAADIYKRIHRGVDRSLFRCLDGLSNSRQIEVADQFLLSEQSFVDLTVIKQRTLIICDQHIDL
jgi:hypothetical protein